MKSQCDKIKVLNLYAGLGGNRKDWKNCQVTAVENDERIVEIYKKYNPDDEIVIGDAHQYLLENSDRFDFIWSSPPCQTHSRMNKATRHKKRRYASMELYEEIIFLQHFFKGAWVVENVVPYYEPLIDGKKMGRHMFWANFEFENFDIPRPKNFINQATISGKNILMDWLGIHYAENIYYGKNHCPAQILRNCVHPKIGVHIFNAASGKIAENKALIRRKND